jgi:hypothetical protein
MSAQDKPMFREYLTPGMWQRDFWHQSSESGLRPMNPERLAIAMRIDKQAKGARKNAEV